MSSCPLSKVRLGYQVLNVELRLEMAPWRPPDLVPRLASVCDTTSAVEARALELAKAAEDAGFSNGRKPSGVATACLYAAGQERKQSLTQAELADAAGVTPVTIRARYEELTNTLSAQSSP